jgi:hypothetical protein
VTTQRPLPRAVRVTWGLLVVTGTPFAAAAVLALVMAVADRSPLALVVAVVAGAVAALHYRVAFGVEAGSTAWWLVALALTAAHSVRSYVDGVIGTGVDVVWTYVIPGVVAVALLWPATVRHALCDHRVITDVA